MSTRLVRKPSVGRFLVVASVLSLVAAAGATTVEQSRREFSVTAKRYAFVVAGSDAAEIRVTQNDLVHVTLAAEDVAHSFTIEEAPYRIMRRAEPGRPVSFDFRADAPGRFDITCNLSADSRCREMHATLVVDRAR